MSASPIASSWVISGVLANRTRSRSTRPSVAGAASGREDQIVACHCSSSGRALNARNSVRSAARSSAATITSSTGSLSLCAGATSAPGAITS